MNNEEMAHCISHELRWTREVAHGVDEASGDAREIEPDALNERLVVRIEDEDSFVVEDVCDMGFVLIDDGPARQETHYENKNEAYALSCESAKSHDSRYGRRANSRLPGQGCSATLPRRAAIRKVVLQDFKSLKRRSMVFVDALFIDRGLLVI